MAKVINPLFADFREAFANCIVFQNNGSGSPIARRKVKQALNPKSPHIAARVPQWANAITKFNQSDDPNKILCDFVIRHAISPDSPKNLCCVSITEYPANPPEKQFTLTWNPVTSKYNGWPCDNLAGYYIEQSFDFVTWTRKNQYPLVENTYTGHSMLTSLFVKVLAVDTENNVSAESQVLELDLTLQTDNYNNRFYNTGFYQPTLEQIPLYCYNQKLYNMGYYG